MSFLRPQLTFDQCDYLIGHSCGYHFSYILSISEKKKKMAVINFRMTDVTLVH